MIDLLDLGKYAAAVVALSGAGAVGWRVFAKAVKAVVEDAIDQLKRSQMEADEDFAATVVALHDRLDEIAECVREVRGQVFPNHGSSLRDKVDELYALVEGR